MGRTTRKTRSSTRRTRSATGSRKQAKVKTSSITESRQPTPQPPFHAPSVHYHDGSELPQTTPRDYPSPAYHGLSLTSPVGNGQSAVRPAGRRLFRTNTNDFIVLAGRRMPIKPPPLLAHLATLRKNSDVPRSVKNGQPKMIETIKEEVKEEEDAASLPLSSAPTPVAKVEPPVESRFFRAPPDPILPPSGHNFSCDLPLFPPASGQIRRNLSRAPSSTESHFDDVEVGTKITDTFLNWENSNQPPEFQTAPTPQVLSREPSFNFSGALTEQPIITQAVWDIFKMQRDDPAQFVGSAPTPQILSRQTSNYFSGSSIPQPPTPHQLTRALEKQFSISSLSTISEDDYQDDDAIEQQNAYHQFLKKTFK